MRSTIEQMKGFMESLIWQDIKDELDAWLKDIHEGLEDPDGKLPDKALHRLGGNAEAVRNFRNMPREMLNNLMEDLGIEDEPEEGVRNE